MRKKIRYLISPLLIVGVLLVFACSCNKDDDNGNSHSFTDHRDGNIYQTVTIGTQEWMSENLAYLPKVVGPRTGSHTTSYYYVFGYDGTSVSAAKATANYTTYGVLYNLPSAKIACPTGWHLPSDAEWTQLTTFLGGEYCAGKLKEGDTSHWESPNTDVNNETGFTALPGGFRSYDDFRYVGYEGIWWSATELTTTNAWYRTMRYFDNRVFRDADSETNYGFSVRCVKD